MNAKQRKAKRYWLRGGLVGIAVVWAVFVANCVGALIYNMVEPPASVFSSEYPLMFPFLVFSLPAAEPASWLAGLVEFVVPPLTESRILAYICLIVVDCLFLFVFGALLGLTFGAVKGVPRGGRKANPPLEG